MAVANVIWQPLPIELAERMKFGLKHQTRRRRVFQKENGME